MNVSAAPAVRFGVPHSFVFAGVPQREVVGRAPRRVDPAEAQRRGRCDRGRGEVDLEVAERAGRVRRGAAARRGQPTLAGGGGGGAGGAGGLAGGGAPRPEAAVRRAGTTCREAGAERAYRGQAAVRSRSLTDGGGGTCSRCRRTSVPAPTATAVTTSVATMAAPMTPRPM